MTEYSRTVSLTATVSVDLVESIIEMAGYGIAYWASSATHYADARTYAVVDGETNTTHVLTYDQLVDALAYVANSPSYHEMSEWARDAIVGDDGAHVDSDLADVVVQTAAFGEEAPVYG